MSSVILSKRFIGTGRRKECAVELMMPVLRLAEQGWARGVTGN